MPPVDDAELAALRQANAALQRQLDEATAQRAASAEVMQLIGVAPGDAEGTLRGIADITRRLLGASSVTVLLADGARWGETLLVGAGAERIASTMPQTHIGPITSQYLPGAVYLENRQIHLPDLDDPAAIARWPGVTPARATGVRATVGTPLRRDGRAIGSLVVHRNLAQPFSDAELALLQGFADQAAIATGNARLIAETREALDRQTATADILKVIARSSTDVQPVLDAIAVAANRLAGGFLTMVLGFVDDTVHLSAFTDTTPGTDAALRSYYPQPLSAFTWSVAILRGEVYLIEDSEVELAQHPASLAMVRKRGWRSAAFVPLLREGKPIGAIGVTRAETGLFAEREVELLKTFADQAVIAIENTRLFHETREALERQTATADILKVIARSSTDVQPVLDAIATAANRLAGGFVTTVLSIADDKAHLAAFTSTTPATDAALRVFYPQPLTTFSWSPAILRGEVYLIEDTERELAHDPASLAIVRKRGWRSACYVPLLREGRTIGTIGVTRADPGLFAEREVELLRTFADQAVIATENAGLLRSLSESLQQQTATADVLKIISRSAFDLQAVLDTLTTSAVELLGMQSGTICVRDGEVFRFRSAAGAFWTEELWRYLQEHPAKPERSTAAGRVVLSGRIEQIPDILDDPEYALPMQALTPGRTPRAMLGVPLLGKDGTDGAMVLSRQDPGPFGQREIDILQTFADQAVIAIENARLFGEVQARTRDLSESLRQQTATAEVLKVISRSVFDLQQVLDTLVESAYRICGAQLGLLYLRSGEAFECKSVVGDGLAVVGPLFKGRPIRAGRGTAAERVILTGEVHWITDFFEDPEFDPAARAGLLDAVGERSAAGELRSSLAVPMMRDGAVVGVLVIARAQTGAFPSQQVELLQTFADQAVIAIENARLFDQVQARTRDLSESLQQQTAVGDVLKVISRSGYDLQAIFDTVLSSAVKLIGASGGSICVRDGDAFPFRSVYGGSEVFARHLLSHPAVPGRSSTSARTLLTGDVVIIPDMLQDPDYALANANVQNLHRSSLGVPLLRDGRVEGAIVLARLEPGTFDPRQIEVVKTFADQAVIAIENTRLFNETKEALEQQKASADVLGVISKSVAAAQPVFDEILSSIERLFSSDDHAIFLVGDGDVLHIGATRGPRADRARALFPAPIDGTATAIAIRDRQLLRVANVFEDPVLPPATRERYRSLGANYSMVIAPLLSSDGAIGSIMVTHTSMIPFTDKECALLRTFADQAVIAIENARLFDEVQAKTRELEESLEQQTATADVLKIISRSAFDLEAVFETVVERSARLTGVEGARANIFRYDGEFLRISATYNVPPEVRAWVEQNPIRPGRHSGTARTALERRTIHVPDVLADPDYTFGAKAIEPYRTILGVPIIKANELLGVLLIYLLEAKPFDDKQISLVETFADQAAIAIENTRLFNETKEALERQTATADVLKVISRSAFDLQNVFDTLLDSAARLVGASNGALCVRDGDVYPYRATIRRDPEWAAYLQAHPARSGRHSISGRVILSGEVEIIADVRRDPEYDQSYWLEGHNSMIGVPLLRSGQVEGVFSLSRSATGGFAQGEIELVRTFADQAVIAIENTRLFDEVQARTRELTQSLDNLRAAQDRLVQTEKLASLGQLTAGIAHEIKNPLNFVNNFAALSADLTDELKEVLDKAAVAEGLRAEVDEIATLLKSNLEKVVQHGKRADSIVRNMLLHSREGSAEHRPTDINALVEESLNLAYHGARAESPQFNVTLARDLDPAAGTIEAFPQEITRVLLNLIGNGFYAMAKRSDANGGGYAAVLNAATRDCGDHVEIRIRDNGTGIPAEVKEKMFNPFFTTKPAGEGTGLGLSMSHDIVVKQHGGTIDVDTAPGAFTEFVIRLPRQSRFGSGG